MSVKTVAPRLCNSTRIYMIFALLMTNCLSFCGVGMTECNKIFMHAKPGRPETTIPQGNIRGINMFTESNRTIFGFLGIPYAQPPIGDLRFRAPVPAGPWNGTLDASTDSHWCTQFDDYEKMMGEEDCLYQNVFTPQLPTSNDSVLRPVMVYVVGGAFRSEDNFVSRFGPDTLLDRDVVLVIPNSRVGVFGYLSTGDEVSPGNYGLKDIVQCLKWVRDNIQYFGGDPNRVTLFGASSGAMIVHLLALSKSTEGLFHRYITQSGSAFSNSANHRKEACRGRAIQLGEYLGCPTNTSTLLVNCLRGLNESQLLESRSMFYVWNVHPVNVWFPTIEPDSEEAVLTDTPANLYNRGKIRDLPWIASVNRDEGIIHTISLTLDPNVFEDFLENFDLALPHVLDYYDVVEDVTAYTNALKSYYMNDLTGDRRTLIHNSSNLFGDGLFGYSVYRAVWQQHLLAKNPHWFGSFQYRGTFSYTYYFSHTTAYTDVAHGDELIYLFGHQGDRLGPPGSEYSESDRRIIDTMVSLWTSFATHGYPTTSDSVCTTVWEPYSSLNNYLRIGDGSDTAIEMQCDLNPERMRFWDELNIAIATSENMSNKRQELRGSP